VVAVDLAHQSIDRNVPIVGDTAQALPKRFFERDTSRMPADDNGTLA